MGGRVLVKGAAGPSVVDVTGASYPPDAAIADGPGSPAVAALPGEFPAMAGDAAVAAFSLVFSIVAALPAPGAYGTSFEIKQKE